MKKKAILISIFSAYALTLQSQEIATDMISIARANPNHLYFGPEVFGLDINTHFKSVRVHGAKFFYGLRLGYEYLKPEAFYFGISLQSCGGNLGFHEFFKGKSIPRSDGYSGFGNLELRFGYTLAPTKWLISPFLCFGGYAYGSGNHHHHFDEGMSYLGAGARSQYEVSRIFNVGLNFKIFGSYYRDERFRFFPIKRYNHHGLWGGEIGVPCTWYIGSHKRWDMQLEPYFLKLTFAEVQNAYGLRFLFGYRF